MPEPSASRRATGTDRIAGGVIALAGAYVAWASGEYPFGTLAEPGPGYLPFVLALILTAFGVVLIARDSVVTERRAVSFADLPHAALLVAVLGAAAFGIERLGYRLTIALMLAWLLIVIERRGVMLGAAVALVMALGSFDLIHTVLRVPLPLGPWGW